MRVLAFDGCANRSPAALKTSSQAEANRLKWPFVTAFKARIDEAKLKQENPKAAALRDATEWRKELANSVGQCSAPKVMV